MQNNISKFISIAVLLIAILNSENINKAMDLYMKGELSLLSEDIVLAERYFNQALNHSPNNPTILLSLLEINIQTKNFINIEKILSQYLNIDKLNINHCLEIISLYKISNRKNLLNIIDSLINNNPNSIELKYAKAEILILKEGWEELLLLYSEIYITEENQDLFDTLLNIGLAIENPDILYKTLKYIWENNKSNIQVLELLIQLSYLSDDDITKEYLEELLQYDPENSFAIMMLAEINIFNNDFFKAIELLNRVKSKGDISLDLYKMLLISYSNVEDYHNEINLSSEIIEKFPFETLGYESLAISYLETGQYINAVEILNKAIKIFPEEYYFYYYLGLCYRNNSKNKEAITFFLKALKINPQLKNVMHELAKLYNLESDYNSSDSLFTILLQENVNDAIIMNDYAYLIADRAEVSLKKLNFALELSQNVISIVPDSPEYLDTIGWIYYKIGKYQIALDYLLRSQVLDKQNSIILEHIGDVYLKLEKYEKALTTYNKIMITNPNNINIIKKIELLKNGK